jgi:hypothetical protein
MSNDLPARLRSALDGTTDHAPALHRRLLYAAGVKIERLRARRWSLLYQATVEMRLNGTTELPAAVHGNLNEAIDELERLRDLLAARIKRGDDGGAPEVIPAGPPKRPRGPLPTWAASVTVDENERGKQSQALSATAARPPTVHNGWSGRPSPPPEQPRLLPNAAIDARTGDTV